MYHASLASISFFVLTAATRDSRSESKTPVQTLAENNLSRKILGTFAPKTEASVEFSTEEEAVWAATGGGGTPSSGKTDTCTIHSAGFDMPWMARRDEREGELWAATAAGAASKGAAPFSQGRGLGSGLQAVAEPRDELAASPYQVVGESPFEAGQEEDGGDGYGSDIAEVGVEPPGQNGRWAKMLLCDSPVVDARFPAESEVDMMDFLQEAGQRRLKEEAEEVRNMLFCFVVVFLSIFFLLLYLLPCFFFISSTSYVFFLVLFFFISMNTGWRTSFFLLGC